MTKYIFILNFIIYFYHFDIFCETFKIKCRLSNNLVNWLFIRKFSKIKVILHLKHLKNSIIIILLYRISIQIHIFNNHWWKDTFIIIIIQRHRSSNKWPIVIKIYKEILDLRVTFNMFNLKSSLHLTRVESRFIDKHLTHNY